MEGENRSSLWVISASAGAAFLRMFLGEPFIFRGEFWQD